MKLTEARLRQIIREELTEASTEGEKFFVVWQQYAPTEDDISRFVGKKAAFSTADAARAKMNRLRAEGGKNRDIKLTYES